jgi:hypothetical protein
MNKKTIIVVIAVVVVALIGYMSFGGSKKNQVPTPDTVTKEVTTEKTVTKEVEAPKLQAADPALLARLGNVNVNIAEFEISGGVKLSSGKATFAVTDTGTEGTISLGKVAIEKDIAGKKYALVILDVKAGGSGLFQHLGLFEEKNGSFEQVSTEFLGSSLDVRSIAAAEISGSNFAIVVNAVDGGVSKQYLISVDGGVINSSKTIVL